MFNRCRRIGWSEFIQASYTEQGTFVNTPLALPPSGVVRPSIPYSVDRCSGAVYYLPIAQLGKEMRVANKRYPGKPNYTGPKHGYFALLHHLGPIVEWSNNVMERTWYINRYKPEHERAIRLSHIVYVPPSMVPDAVRKARDKYRKASAEYFKARFKPDDADYRSKRERFLMAQETWEMTEDNWRRSDGKKLLAYLKRHVKDCRWNGTELDFGKS